MKDVIYSTVLGPSTIRDTVGSMISFSGGDAWYNITVKNDTRYFNESDYYFSRGLSELTLEQNLEAFESVEKNSVDLYATVRSIFAGQKKEN